MIIIVFLRAKPFVRHNYNYHIRFIRGLIYCDNCCHFNLKNIFNSNLQKKLDSYVTKAYHFKLIDEFSNESIFTVLFNLEVYLLFLKGYCQILLSFLHIFIPFLG